MAKRTPHQSYFTGKVAPDALKDNKALATLAQEHNIHLVQITKWKARPVQEIAQLFEDRLKKKEPLE